MSMSSPDLDRRDTVLSVRNLVKHYRVRGASGRQQVVHAVDGVQFDLRRGETLGVVGESGCGKSTLGRVLTGLLEPTSGSIFYCGEDVTMPSRQRRRELRKHIQILFQDPYSSLDPRMTTLEIIGEPLRANGWSTTAARQRVLETMDMVGLDPVYAKRYPHQFSGGQRQRIGLARALALEPSILILDEPVSALDVSIQAQILNLLQDLQETLGITYVFISHDLSVVRHISDQIAVMYLGQFAEYGTTQQVYDHPQHCYTQALLSAVPVPDPDAGAQDVIVLNGDLPNPSDPPIGCRFQSRCWRAADICRAVPPRLTESTTGHQAACHFPGAGT
ncbi:dipeptide ABC transporter ATP-binding protein [Ramlibacter tataouinensis]|uniref:ABC transporter ATP-binding protein n=1 Tax=Ramlibacter tataouinensis TaxID=94132 RepID=UPI0022F3D788|nr:dipeptide ABC transporter ATP-binding protein [Ramlibacter tataouinensis]WBY02767.1 dipeptide ABC transporter ATP-binding protein [Ramlibacter tataouinensis]